MAFNAIAQDPHVLHRAARPQAVRMAAQAEVFALDLTESTAAKSDTWLAAGKFVLREIEAWRRSLKAFDTHREVVGTDPGPRAGHMPLSDPWDIAQRNFPYVDEDTGKLATRILREFGAAVLRRARKPWDHIIALAVLRHAARLLRVSPPGFDAAPVIANVRAVQAYAESEALSPLLVGYSGPGRPAQQALGLYRDARILRDAVGEPVPAPIWQQAIDVHAFAVVALDRRILLELPLTEAYELAAAAVRHADLALREPSMGTQPFLPFTSTSAPEVVRLHALACLPGKAAAPSDQPDTNSRAR
ncbi:MAG: hypothetical protein JO157_11210 [Acetobacteraceae bacterium]|nr:hypothetical protein [Acetobacteraceae bacterium]